MRLTPVCAILTWTLTASLQADPPPGYYDSANGLSGTALKSALHNIIDGHTVIPYDQLFPVLKVLWEDPNNSSNILLIYGGTSVAKTATTWNREHMWPRSRGVDDTGPDTSDLFHIAPCDDDVNSQRSNLYYDNSSALDGGIVSPAHPEAPLCTRDANSWEPPAKEKGDIARALFYMATRYDGTESLTTDLELVNGAPSGPQMANLDTLLQWNAADPPDAAEQTRNDLIFTSYQHNRNPFIDHPEWVTAIWGSGSTQMSAQALATDASASESPQTTGTYTIQLSKAAGTGGLTVGFTMSGAAVPADYALTGTGVTFNASSGTGSIVIPAGATIATIALSPVDDGIAEGSETAVITLNTGTGYVVAGTSATITITDAPSAPPPGTIATWAFDTSSFPDPLPSDTGAASLSFAGWTGQISSFSGVTGQSLALVSFAGNGSHIDFKCSTLGWGGLVLNFQTRGTSTGYDLGTWSWSTDGANFSQLAGVNTATRNTAFAARVVDFSGVTALNHCPNVTLRYTLNGATSDLGNNRIDDFAIHATALPRVSISATPNSTQEGSGIPIIFTLTSDTAAPAGGLPVSVVFAGSASSENDYSLTGVNAFDAPSAVASITIPAGATTASFQLLASNDANPIELDESVIAQVFAGAGGQYAAGASPSAAITIKDRTPYNAAWVSRFPALQPAQAAPQLDVDGDGLTNLEEFARDSDPITTTPNVAPILSTALYADPTAGGSLQSFATYTFVRRTDSNAPTCLPQSSADLAAWNSDLVLVTTVAGPTAATEKVTYRSAKALTGPAASLPLYVRLRTVAAP